MKRLLLLGGGHAHTKVLLDLIDRPIKDWDVHLVTPHPRQVYSGMLPGWIAGQYALDECTVDLVALASRAKVNLHLGAANHLDLRDQTVRCSDGSSIAFDALSVDTGPVSAISDLSGDTTRVQPIRPIERFIRSWEESFGRLTSQCHRLDLVIVGGGAASVELAFAVKRRTTVDGWSHIRVSLIGPGPLPLQGAPTAARRLVALKLAERGIRWLGGKRLLATGPNHLQFDNGPDLYFDECLVVTGAAAPPWPRDSGLATDPDGFISVGPTLQSVSHPNVFAAGDIAAYSEPRPKSGVYAVKAGPTLSKNLRAFCEGQTLSRWTPQARALYLLSTADGDAVGTWGPFTASGRLLGRLKNHIDRRFIKRFGATSSIPLHGLEQSG